MPLNAERSAGVACLPPRRYGPARHGGAWLHVDAAQSMGKCPIDFASLGVDLMSLSAHKAYGPKGVGALYVRSGTTLAPRFFGGHAERDRRPGTENVPGIIAIGKAAELARKLLAEDDDGAVVGCLQLCILPGLSSQGACRALIEDVRVASHCRSRGIGEQLVQWAISEARAKSCKLVELLTHNSRVDAQRFYKRLGFAPSHLGMTWRF